LQERALGLFKESLARKGFLGLGSKESMRFSDYADSFTDCVRDEKIYQKWAN
jgi:chemotaxis protein methyltransferase CheR